MSSLLGKRCRIKYNTSKTPYTVLPIAFIKNSNTYICIRICSKEEYKKQLVKKNNLTIKEYLNKTSKEMTSNDGWFIRLEPTDINKLTYYFSGNWERVLDFHLEESTVKEALIKDLINTKYEP